MRVEHFDSDQLSLFEDSVDHAIEARDIRTAGDALEWLEEIGFQGSYGTGEERETLVSRLVARGHAEVIWSELLC